jgi:hypothetical protein
MIKSIFTFLTLTAAAVLFTFSGCTKEVPKELLQNNKQSPMGNQNMPNDSIHRNIQKTTGTDTSSANSDKVVAGLTKDADDADAKFEKTKSDADKKAAVEKQMLAANFLMFEAELPPKQKYKPALKRYRRVLQLDPNNKEAAANKKQIEDIYQSMGMPIPD